MTAMQPVTSIETLPPSYFLCKQMLPYGIDTDGKDRVLAFSA
jgi:hypothetical protein